METINKMATYWLGENVFKLSDKQASLVAQIVKNLSARQETRFNPWVGKIPWRRKWQTAPSILAWKILQTENPGRLQSMGSESGMTDWLTLSFSSDKWVNIQNI